MTEAAKKTAAAAKAVVENAEEIVEDVAPVVISAASKVGQTVGFGVGFALNSALLVTAGVIAFASGRIAVNSVAHLVTTGGKVWLDSPYLSR